MTARLRYVIDSSRTIHKSQGPETTGWFIGRLLVGGRRVRELAYDLLRYANDDDNSCIITTHNVIITLSFKRTYTAYCYKSII